MKKVQVLRLVPETREECMQLPQGNCGYSNDSSECTKMNHK